MAGVGVWIGWYLTSFTDNHTTVILASIASALVCGAGNSLNDYLDINADKLNHPERPLPKGDLPPYIAILTMIIFNIIAIILGFMINFPVLVIIITAILLLFLYNFKLKKMPLVGNLIVSILGGALFLVGGLTENGQFGALPGPIVPAIFAFLFHLGRELVKDIADLDGDLKANYKTLAAVLPHQQIMAIITFLFVTLIFLTIIPVYYKWYLQIYSYIAFFAVDIPLMLILFYLYLSKSPKRYGLASNFMKLLMLFGLFAFYLGKITVI
ncbi:MAG: UbiA family prenyltransferase [candidate division Zixibacteria bacterium]|nr:UbiA family prenyltransferase [candidate division Zixibacteria bacterium]